MYKLNDEKVFYDMAEGQAVVIDFTIGSYYGFSSLGSEVLDRLVKGADESALLGALRETPGCPEGIGDDLQAFLEKLTGFGILLPAPGEGAEASVPLPAAALEDGFALTVDDHSEVSEILLADPVHDVDMDMGWPILKEDE